ncbi:MAG: hypothetical protein A2161_16170 [Candidatus Schekmanbacteria bacterium RBG_13_48_7]|uniref:Uncharacterized protein n=1 Tax=Candidatus Schekmanbacteria bacterium RBG_13_48_7 TaxID=1817878 RepID=A0A1F7RTB8_9BACT|nr:MAG: hypothetical protein A2161_16170 [Candidatus Schekmanbacteria bacterium RBG_13_48_7]
MKKQNNYQIPIYIFAVVILTAAVYSNTIHAGFVYDDYFYIVNNPLLQSTSMLKELLTSEYARGYRETAVYRPVANLTYFLNIFIGGMKPHEFHVFNVLLHVIVTVMVFIIAYLLFSSRTAAFIAALCFGLHPVHTESVAWIVGRTELLAALFVLLAFFFYVRQEPAFKISKMIFSLVFYLMALFSKENAVILPLIIIAYDYIVKRIKISVLFKQFFKYYFPYFIMVLVWILVRWVIIGYIVPSGGFRSAGNMNIIERFVTIIRVLGYYVFLQLFPFNLCVDYDFRIESSLLSGSFLISCFILLCCVLYIILYRKKNPEPVFLMLWFFIALVPVSNVIPIGEIVAERFLYLPSVGFHVLLGVLSARLISSRKSTVKRIVASFLIAGLFSGYFYLTFSRNKVWFDSKSLWLNVLKNSPEKTRTQVGIGSVYMEEGDLDKAEKHFQRAIKLNNNVLGVARAWLNCGQIYQDKKQFDDAMNCYEETIKIAPNLYRAYNNLGAVYLAIKQPDKAIIQLSEAIKLEKYDPGVYQNLGNAYQQMGNFQEAITVYEKALNLANQNEEIRMNMVYAMNNWASSFLSNGNFDEAISRYKQAISINPNFEGSYLNLAVVYMRMNKPDQAINLLNSLLNLQPSNEKALEFLFQIYTFKIGDQDQSRQILSKMVKTTISPEKIENFRKLYREKFEIEP